MPVTFIDLETRSRLNVNDVGAYRYAPECTVILACWAIDNGPVHVWQEGDPIPSFDTSGLFVAANTAFERLVLRHQWGIDIPIEHWHCVLAHARSHAFPGSLAGVAKALSLDDTGEDKLDGQALIRLFCTERGNSQHTRHTHPAEWAAFVDYCRSDVLAARAAYHKLPTVNFKGAHIGLWHADQRINDRGFRIDRKLCEAAIAMCGDELADASARIEVLTGGRICTPNQVERIAEFCGLADLTKATVKIALETESDPIRREVLEIRQALGRSSTAKYRAMLETAGDDDRVRGCYNFRGAGRTGRWSGWGPQPQNLPGCLPKGEIPSAIAAVKAGGAELIYDRPLDLAAKLLKPTIIPADGHSFVIADYSQVEARFGAWIANEQRLIKVFEGGRDVYKDAYVGMFGGDYDAVTKAQRQAGKVAVLALFYAGGAGALASMAHMGGFKPHELAAFAWETASPDLREQAVSFLKWMRDNGMITETPKGILVRGVVVAPETYVGLQCVKIGWRAANPHVVAYWALLFDAAVKAMQKPGTAYAAGRVKFIAKDDLLALRLPSGRFLFYPAPKLSKGKRGLTITFQDWQRGRQPLIPGLIMENVCQAGCADIQGTAIQECDRLPLPVVMHTHDEIVLEVPTEEAEAAKHMLEKIMTTGEPWTAGLPLKADAYIADRLRKDE